MREGPVGQIVFPPETKRERWWFLSFTVGPCVDSKLAISPKLHIKINNKHGHT